MSCPVCRRPGVPEFRPFCSKRCADIDLGRWLTGRYAIAADDEDATDPSPEDGGGEDAQEH